MSANPTHSTKSQQHEAPISYDPYDLWMTGIGVKAKDAFYRGTIWGKLLCILIAVFDWILPTLSRRLTGAKMRAYPITVAQWILAGEPASPSLALDALKRVSVPDSTTYGAAWGLGFPWMSKNGLYDETLPFITHTPYAMEALLELMQQPQTRAAAESMFHRTWEFLEKLQVMYEDESQLALSYAPVHEPRIVVNANAYAAFAYSLHARYGEECKRTSAAAKAIRLARWVVSQQRDDGSWLYYADEDDGNFIDCFHSCFVLKNLLKASHNIDEITPLTDTAIAKGLNYIDDAFYSAENGLVKRFVVRDIKDPFVWDLYDQAEYLGVLALMGETQRAAAIQQAATQTFYKNGHWYCRKDFFGMLWGKNFLRWGIYPMLHNVHLLNSKSDR